MTDAATQRLAARGLLGPDGVATPDGTALYQDAERATDLAAARPWIRLGPARTARLAELIEPVATACSAAGPSPASTSSPTAARSAT